MGPQSILAINIIYFLYFYLIPTYFLHQMYTSILKVTALFYFIPIIFAMPQDHIGNFFGGLLKVPEEAVRTVQEFSFEGAGEQIDKAPENFENTLKEAGRTIEDFTFEEAGENIDQIVRDIRNIAQRGLRNSAHH